MNRELVERSMDDFVVGDAWPRPTPEDASVPAAPPDVEAASAILRRLKSLDRDRAQVNAVVDAEVRRLEAFREDSVAGIKTEMAWGERAVEAFMRVYALSAHKKTLALADGTLKLRAPGAGRIILDDEGALIEWARKRNAVSSDPNDPSVVNLKPTVSRTVLGQWYPNSKEPIAVTVDDDGGEVNVYALIGPDGAPIPGVSRVIARDDKFDLTIGED